MNVVIMAAGRGSRLKPLTDDKPKCMVEVAGKPILQHIYDNIYKSIFKPNIHIIVNYRMDVILDYAKEHNLGLNYIIQDKLDGTAGAIQLTKNYMEGDFIVLSGDVIYSPKDLKKLSKAVNTLFYTEQNERLYEYGTLDMYREHLIFINEKSTKPTSNFVNCGAYHFTPQVFDYIDKTMIDDRFNEKIITNTINMMIDDGIPFRGIHIDSLNEVSRVEDIKKVESKL